MNAHPQGNNIYKRIKIMSNNKKPTFNAYVVTKNENSEQDFWRQIGAAWESEKCISIKLDAIPVNGELVLMKPKEKQEAK